MHARKYTVLFGERNFSEQNGGLLLVGVHKFRFAGPFLLVLAVPTTRTTYSPAKAQAGNGKTNAPLASFAS